MSCIDVHIQDIVSTCLSADIKRVGNGIIASAYKSTPPYELSVKRIDAVLVDVSVVRESLRISAFDSAHHPIVRCGIVCSLTDIILNVTPDEIQWITDDTGVFFDVESNVEWIVLTS